MQRQRPNMAMAQTGRTLTALVGPLAALLWVGCYNPDDYALNSDASPSVDRFLTLEADGATTLPADGVSAVELVARVRDVSEGPLTLQFTTTAGSLRVGTTVGTLVSLDSIAAGISVNSVVRPDSVVVRTDARGEARVELVSAPRPATARVRAAVLGVDAPLEQVLRIDFSEVPAAALVAFVDPAAAAFAHGLSLVPVTVQIAAQLVATSPEVTFAASGGTFPFADEPGSTQTVRADADGRATAYLRSPEAPSDVQVRASVAGFSQEHLIHFVPAPADSVLRFVAPPQAAPADGETLTGFTVSISPRLQSLEDRTVAFTATGGSFLFAGTSTTTASVRADADGQATAWLRSPARFGEVVVRASVKGFVQDNKILFDWAGPDSIVVRPERSRLQVTAGEQMAVEAELLRYAQPGQVTVDLPIAFTATDSLGRPLRGARFLEVTPTDAQRVATAVFVVDDTLYWGPVTISARPARLASGVVGQAQVTILRP